MTNTNKEKTDAQFALMKVIREVCKHVGDVRYALVRKMKCY